MRELSGLVMMVGSVLFLTVAFMPVTLAFVVRDVEQVHNSVAWVIANALFVAGTVVMVVAVLLLVLHLRQYQTVSLAWASGAVFAVAAACWIAICYYRLALPLEQVFREPNLGYLFVAYT